MTIQKWLDSAKQKLNTASVPTARLDAEVLLADLLQKDRSWLHSHPENVLQRSDLRTLDEQVERRRAHEPIAYIRGKQEFYGRDFIVSPDTLTPRPETETMVEMFLDQVSSFEFPVSRSSKLKTQNSKLSVVDVGAGSGCIVISAALELAQISNLKSKISYVGLDISKPALKIAKKNAVNLNADVEFKHFDLLSDDLSNIQHPMSNIYLANLPYVPDDFHINLAATHEPKFAIFGGEDGLDYYRTLFAKLKKEERGKRKEDSCIVFTEALPPQHEELERIAKDAGFKLQKTQDFIQLFESTESKS
jgi:release factor glutamine methyltransferase